MASLGWPVRRFYALEALAIEDDDLPLAIVIDTAGDSMMATALASAIRKRRDILAFAPLLAIGTPPTMDTEPQSARIDQWLAPDLTGAQMAVILTEWTMEPNPVLERLMAVFGQGEIISLAARFRDMLIEALDAIETPAASMMAHRVTGMAGTLGFTSLSAGWAMAHSAEQGVPAVERATRKAIFEISRRVQRDSDWSVPDISFE